MIAAGMEKSEVEHACSMYLDIASMRVNSSVLLGGRSTRTR